MITGYEIVNDKLYLYIDISSEFGNKIDFFKIKDFIKRKRKSLAFGVALIVINGMVVGKVNLRDLDNSNNNYVASTILKMDEPEEIKKLEEVPIIEEEIIDEESEELNTDEIINNTKEIVTNKVNNKVSNNTKNNVEVKVESKEEKQEVVESHINEYVDNSYYVNVKIKNKEIVKIEVEEYVVGVVAAEMPALFNEQALMAQAIIARTYAMKAIDKNMTLSDNESTQSYKTKEDLKTLWQGNYDKYYEKIRNAVANTKGMYLIYNNQYIEAVYHSTSNGQTEDAVNVWGNSFPYLVSVASPGDTSNPSFTNKKTISYQELSSKLGFNVDMNVEFNILGKTSGNRVSEIKIGEKVYSGVNLRNILGLRSADFDIEKNNDGVEFTTRGYGHGVGLSQYGANAMAKEGKNYEQILLHYYPGVTIEKK